MDQVDLPHHFISGSVQVSRRSGIQIPILSRLSQRKNIKSSGAWIPEKDRL